MDVRTNTKNADVKTAGRPATLEQLAYDDEIWNDVQISFLPIQNFRSAREVYMDLSVSTPTLFDKISNLDLYDGDSQCQIKGRGAPVAANIFTVCCARGPPTPKQTSKPPLKNSMTISTSIAPKISRFGMVCFLLATGNTQRIRMR